MCRQIRYLFILFFILVFASNARGQADDFKLVLENCEVKGDSVLKLDNAKFGFSCDYNFSDEDTVWIKFIHHKGTAPLNVSTFSCTKMQPSVSINYSCIFKPGDKLMFSCYTAKRKYPVRDFKIISTSSSLDVPYYDDFYFVYNSDTINKTEFEFLASRDSINREGSHASVISKVELHSDFIRVFYWDLSKIPAYVGAQFHGHNFLYDFDRRKATIYHGRIILEFHDRKDLLDIQPYDKSLHMADKDCPGGWRSFRQFELSSKREMKRFQKSFKQNNSQSKR